MFVSVLESASFAACILASKLPAMVGALNTQNVTRLQSLSRLVCSALQWTYILETLHGQERVPHPMQPQLVALAESMKEP